MVTLLREAYGGILDLVYPPRCLVCRELGPEILCAACRNDFSPLEPPLCSRCGDMIASTPMGLCVPCQRTTYYFHQARAAGRYDGALRRAILALKYGSRRKLAEPLGKYLADYLRAEEYGGLTSDIIVPVPLHPSRQRDRGFNQSALLAHAVGCALDLPVAGDVLRRVRKTRPQVGLTTAERTKNVRGAFRVADHSVVSGRSILLIDDVLTTLNTVDECARMLAAAGARRIDVAGVARGL
jgi:ComF family protein